MNNSRKDQRVYLSKSNQANPDQVTLVRAYLIELGYEIVEHTGGQYKESLLGSCTYMVMVGWDQPDSEGGAFIGKGQHGQFEARVKRDYHYNYYFIGMSNTTGKPKFRGVTHLGVGVDSSDWSNYYSTIHLKMDRAHSSLTVISNAPNKQKKKVNITSDQRLMASKGVNTSWLSVDIELHPKKDSPNMGKVKLAAVRITRTF